MNMLEEKNKTFPIKEIASLILGSLVIILIFVASLVKQNGYETKIYNLEMKVIRLELKVEQTDPIIQFFHENKKYLLPADSEPVKEK